MRPLRIDFAPRSMAGAIRRTPLASWLMLAIAAALWLGFALQASSLAQQKEAVAAQLIEARQQVQAQLDARADRERAIRDFTIPEAELIAVNHAIGQLNLPWRDLLDALEAATPATIALLAIEPDAKKHVLKGTAEARSSDDMIAYIEQLQRQPLFVGVQLRRHEINEQDPNLPLRFQFEAQWAEVLP